ncbi:ZTA1 [[Candida] subhashii]|uniref:Probable quinone oxidoreductase n=1 Tax=[Candida] subhashii TaxID=561895 RepID=A0A8J5QNS3_9ASCO|nr:ZTA1 [[Candida] subhashii]KAG7663698.1 ZTA1 [[Candida] subhashii]
MTAITLPSTQKAVFHEEIGEYDVLKYDDVPTPTIESSHDIIVKNAYAGVNFIEAYFRKGIYKAPSLPYVFGREASGEVVAIGNDVKNLAVGDKIAYLSANTFAQYTKIDDSLFRYIKLNSDASDEELKVHGSIYLQGLTALTFINEAYKVKQGDYILVWAAAGGVGKILVQLISQLGAHVIAIASTPEKLQAAKELGAEYLINSSTDDIVAKVQEITNGQGVDASFDSIGKDTFETSLSSIKRKGTFVSYGNASGPVTPFPLAVLSPKNIKIVRPQLFAYIDTPEEWKHYSQELLKLIEQGKLKFDISKTYELKDYPQAAKDLEGRKTTGKLTLKIPQ